MEGRAECAWTVWYEGGKDARSRHLPKNKPKIVNAIVSSNINFTSVVLLATGPLSTSSKDLSRQNMITAPSQAWPLSTL